MIKVFKWFLKHLITLLRIFKMIKSFSWAIDVTIFYTINISKYDSYDRCFSNMHDQSWLWHRRLGHANMDLISQLNKDELVRGLLKIIFQKNKVCESCQVGKQIKNYFKNTKFISTTRPLELLHMNLFSLSRTPSLEGISYTCVIVDEFFSWVVAYEFI